MSEEDADGVDAMLDRAGFDPERSVLTRRQAAVLALRERGESQEAIANTFGTSRANISSIEASARRNIENARETVAVAEALQAPVQIEIAAGTDLFAVPDAVYQACDESNTKVTHSSAGIIRELRDRVEVAIDEDQVTQPLLIGVDADGRITIRESRST